MPFRDEYFQKSTNPITEAIDDIHTLIHTISDMIEADPEYIIRGYVKDKCGESTV